MNALVAVGFLPGDGPRFVKECRYEQDATRRSEGPAVEIKRRARWLLDELVTARTITVGRFEGQRVYRSRS